MDEKSCSTVATNSRNLAENYIKSKNFGRAFSHFLIALKLQPTWKEELKETFSSVLFKWGTILEESNRFSDLFNCYEQATEAFPDNEYILDNLGALLLKHGLVKEAAHYFRESLNVRPNFLRALRNLENVSNLVVPRWHFRMLNDSKRNGAFREAIAKKVTQGLNTILDIGTGTGILSLFALEAGAKEIVACDSSSYMMDVASLVIQENNANRIRLVGKHSRNMEIPEDVPERVKLVVTEIVDCGLLGENVLDTLIDSWDRLISPSGAVIPFGAVVYIAGIECEYIRKKHALADRNKFFDLNDCNVTSKEDGYDSECLSRVPNGFKYLTNVYKSVFINFNDREQMEKISSGELDECVRLKCLHEGRLDCFLAWFDLHVDEDIVLGTSPNSESSDSWDQAVFPLPTDFCVAKDDCVSAALSYKNGKIALSGFKLEKCEAESGQSVSEDRDQIFRLSEDVVRTLNSDLYKNCFDKVCDIVTSSGQSVSVLDTFPFPFLGLNILMKDNGRKSILKSVVRDEESRSLLRALAKKYDLEGNVRLIEEGDLSEMDENEKYDVILVNLIEHHGELKDKTIPLLDVMRSYLKPNGLLIPEEVTVMGQLIESEWLEKMSNVVGDAVTFGYRIGKFINCYRVNTHIDFDLNGIEKIARSEPFEMCRVLPGEFTHNIRVPAQNDGYVNALAIWYRIKFTNDAPEISTLHDGVTNHAAILFPKTFVTGWVQLKITYDNGLLKAEIL